MGKENKKDPYILMDERSPEFICDNVMVIERTPVLNISKVQTAENIKLEINLISSGDTSEIPIDSIVAKVLEKLKSVKP